jgi:hypothetical protein
MTIKNNFPTQWHNYDQYESSTYPKESNKFYIVCLRKNLGKTRLRIAQFTDDHNWQSLSSTDGINLDITHWCELPPEPEE